MRRLQYLPLGVVCLTVLYVIGRLWREYPCNHGGEVNFLRPIYLLVFIVSLLMQFSKYRVVALVSLILSLAGYLAVPYADYYNVFIDYPKWTERGMPEIFTHVL